MDNISVVVDSEVLSRWKFNSFAWINNNFAIKEVLLLGKSKETSIKTTLYSFLIKEIAINHHGWLRYCILIMCVQCKLKIINNEVV